jgi:transposase
MERSKGRTWSASSQACPTPDPGQAFGGLGWLAHPSQQSRKEVSGGWGGFSAAAGAATRLYAPELNPDEGIWKHLKYVELKNICCRSLSDLRVELRKAKERLRHKKHIILGCIRQAGFKI